MSFAFVGSASAVGSGVTSLSCNRPPGIAVGNLLIAAYAFEGVAPGSGPWIIPNTGQYPGNTIGPAEGWLQACWVSPAGTGTGLEVWIAINGGVNPFVAQFAAAQNVVAVTTGYSGEYNPIGTITAGTLRVAATAQVTGDKPAAPTVNCNTGDLLVAIGADAMGGGGFGSPSGFTSRVDANRAGAGTAEAAIADVTAAFSGATGLIIFPNAAASSTTKGATATLAFVPAPTGSSVGPILDVPMPEDLDLGDGWTLRVTALDPVTGAAVPGVTVSDLAMEVVDVNESGAGVLDFGEFLLVPGPGA